MAITVKKGFKLKEVKIKVKTFKKTVPIKLGNIARNHFLDGFRKQGGQTDASISGWRKRKTSRTKIGRSRNTGRALLVDSGKMKSGIKRQKTTFRRIEIGVRGLEYAFYVNNGTKRMPKREFIGKSRVLEKKLKNKIIKEVDKIWK